MARREDLSRPARPGLGVGVHYDPDAFGRFSESLARFFGTARFIVFQTIVVIVWILFNVVAINLRWDPYPFILLNLAFSLQAAYVAPLILLAQNRQADRDRVDYERDRETAARTQTEAEYLARELASVRLALADVVTSEDLGRAVDRVTDALGEVRGELAGSGRGPGSTGRSAAPGDDAPVAGP